MLSLPCVSVLQIALPCFTGRGVRFSRLPGACDCSNTRQRTVVCRAQVQQSLREIIPGLPAAAEDEDGCIQDKNTQRCWLPCYMKSCSRSVQGACLSYRCPPRSILSATFTTRLSVRSIPAELVKLHARSRLAVGACPYRPTQTVNLPADGQRV